MGYYFNIRGCYRTPPGSCDLAAEARRAFAARPAWAGFRPDMLYAVLGPDANHVVFATESKDDAYTYLLFLRDLARVTPHGTGLVNITGECHDGRGKMIPIYAGRLHDVPVDETYALPWRPLTHACHDLDYARVTEPSDLLDAAPFPAPPPHVASAWAAVSLPAQPLIVDLAESGAAAVVAATPALRPAVGTMRWFGEPRILLADDRPRSPAIIAAATAALTRHHPSAGALLLATDWQAGVFHPVLLYAGRARPITPVSLRRPDGTGYPEWDGRDFTGLSPP